MIFMVLPFLLALFWIFFDVIDQAGAAQVFTPGSVTLDSIPIKGPITALTKVLGFCVTMIPVGFNMAAFYFLVKLFGLYAQGNIFTAENVRCIRKVGYILLIRQMISPFIDALMYMVLTMNNPQGERMIGFGFSSANFSQIIIALLIILVSWIMDEGRKLKDEEALVI